MVTNLDLIHNDLKELKKEVESLKRILIPEEKISEKERNEMKKILAAMEKGEETKLENVFRN